jgi:hypothetical protein
MNANAFASPKQLVELGTSLTKALLDIENAPRDLVQEIISTPGRINEIARSIVVPETKPEPTRVEIVESTPAPILTKTGLTLGDWLKAREELHRFWTGETVVLRDKFVFTEEDLARQDTIPVFRPAGATNRMAVDWKRRLGVTVYEEVDVIRYTNSKGLKKHELYLISRSLRPDEETLGENAKTPGQLTAIQNKLWLNLFGWADADSLNFAITGEHLDPETWTWFPNDRLPNGNVASGNWGPCVRRVKFGRSRCDYYWTSMGARAAVKVSLRS